MAASAPALKSRVLLHGKLNSPHAESVVLNLNS